MKVAGIGVGDPEDQVGGHENDGVFDGDRFEGPGIGAPREGPGQGFPEQFQEGLGEPILVISGIWFVHDMIITYLDSGSRVLTGSWSGFRGPASRTSR